MIENHQIVASLYKKDLLEVKDWTSMDAMEGDYINKIMIIYDITQHSLPESQKKLLDNILKAIGLQTDDIQLLNWQHSSIQQFWQLKRSYQPKRIIGFGISPRTLGLIIHAYKYRQFTFDEVPFLFSDTLEQIESDVALKRKLWVALQQMFTINKEKS